MAEKLPEYANDAIVAESHFDTAQELERARVALVVEAANEAAEQYGEPHPVEPQEPESV